MTNGIYLLLGSNLADREENLLLAIKKINEQAGNVLSVSSLYITEPWGISDQPRFLNQVIEIESNCLPGPLLKRLLSIETEIGRKKTERWGPRKIDIDILFYADTILKEIDLQIPHPGIPNRRFTLVPLCEIAPGFVHPELYQTCAELLQRCNDPLHVKLYVPRDSSPLPPERFF